MYGGHDENYMFEGCTFQERYAAVMDVLRECLPISSDRIDANTLAGV
jgi:hypothetical protein